MPMSHCVCVQCRSNGGSLVTPPVSFLLMADKNVESFLQVLDSQFPQSKKVSTLSLFPSLSFTFFLFMPFWLISN